MHEYGLTLSEAIDIPDAIASDLLRHASRRRFYEAENQATLIQAKVSELLTGKKAKYQRPDDAAAQQKEETPMSEAALNKLERLFNG